MTEPAPKSGMENPAVLDAIAYDQHTDEVTLAMYELRNWSDLDLQLFQLQEKLNSYASFALDGELAETYPDFVGKRVRIQLRTPHEPPDKVMEFVALIREQLSFQNVIFEVVHIENDENEGCGAPGGCGCQHS
ncbi:MAG: DUF6572 domain-containing protein [Chthoniobacterales bacterium]